MKVSVFRETYPNERRVALVPLSVPQLAKAGIEVLVEQGAGLAAGIPDQRYREKGATVVADRSVLFEADLIVQVHCPRVGWEGGRADLARLRAGSYLIGMCDPLGTPESVRLVAATGAGLFALELIPRITRGQAMDVLSSQATIAGYRAVILSAFELSKVFPLMMTAAGTLAAARVFVIGAGVAGLQAIATARRLGAIVHAYDVRPATREQVESLGGKYVELALEAGDSQDKGGYAKALGDEFYARQQALMASVVAESDIVITTAAVPGKPSPRLVTASAVAGMQPGSVIVDLAAERGGNCELSQPDRRIVEHGIVIHGPTNLASEVPLHASQMYSNNVTRFVLNLVKQGRLTLDLEDEIIRETLVCDQKQVTSPRLRELLGITVPGAGGEPAAAATTAAPAPASGHPLVLQQKDDSRGEEGKA